MFRSLENTWCLYQVLKSPWNSQPCRHLPFSVKLLGLFCRGEFGSSSVCKNLFKLTGNVKTFLRINDFCTSEAIASHTQSVLLRKVVWRQKLIVKARVLANRVIKGGYRMPIYQKILVLKNCNLSLKNYWNLVVWRCSGGSRGGAQGHLPSPVLFLDQNEARRAKKISFGDWAKR